MIKQFTMRLERIDLIGKIVSFAAGVSTPISIILAVRLSEYRVLPVTMILVGCYYYLARIYNRKKEKENAKLHREIDESSQ